MSSTTDPAFQIYEGQNACFIINGRPSKPTFHDCYTSGFVVYVGTNVDHYETPAFRLFNSEIWIKLSIKQKPNFNTCPSGKPAIQLLLVKPEHDVLPVTVNGFQGILTSGSTSFTYCDKSPSFDHGRETGKTVSVQFNLKFASQWNSSFESIECKDPADVTLQMGDREISTRRQLLSAHSDVFKAMFTHDTKEKQTGIVIINDFPFEVVQEIIRFMMHNYCCLWYTRYEELAAIADKYNNAGMKALALKKKEIIDKL